MAKQTVTPHIRKGLLAGLLASLICGATVRADNLSASIRTLIETTQRLANVAQQASDSGDQQSCDRSTRAVGHV